MPPAMLDISELKTLEWLQTRLTKQEMRLVSREDGGLQTYIFYFAATSYLDSLYHCKGRLR